jgi:hypothetical protein
MTSASRALCFGAAVLAGCGTSTSTPNELPLAMLEPTLVVKRDAGGVHLSLLTSGCNQVDPQVRVVLDGVASDSMQAGGLVETCEDFGTCTSVCNAPTFTWTAPAAIAGPSTFVVTDGETSWMYSVDQPAVKRTFQLVAPTVPTLHSGDAVTLRMTPATGTSTEAAVDAFATTTVFSVDERSGLTRTGADLTFTVPSLTSAAEATLTTSARFQLATIACDAPLGCVAGVEDLVANIPVSLAP